MSRERVLEEVSYRPRHLRRERRRRQRRLRRFLLAAALLAALAVYAGSAAVPMSGPEDGASHPVSAYPLASQQTGQLEPPASGEDGISRFFSDEEFDGVVSGVLDGIIAEDMTQLEQARAVFVFVHDNIRYTGSSDKSDWKSGAYLGLTTQQGDCFTYYAASRALLTALDIDNLEVERAGGETHHFWNLVNCGDGWYHFDACPRSSKLPEFFSFMFTDQQAEEFTAEAGRCYYNFDSSLLPRRAEKPVTGN